MTATRPVTRLGEMVPVGARLRYTQLLRVGFAVLIAAFAVARPQMLGAGIGDVWLPTLLYLGLTGIAEVGWRVVVHRAVALFVLMLMLDGVFFGCVTYLSGGVLSPVSYLICLHIVAITLLASFRTGLTVTLWNSLVVVGFFLAQHTGLLTRPTDAVRGLPGSTTDRLVVFVIMLWLVVIGTAMFSAVNERGLRHRQYELEALTDMALALESATGSVAVAEVLLEHVIRAFGFPRGVVVGAGDSAAQVLAVYRGAGETGDQSRLRGSAVIARAHKLHETVLVTGLHDETDAGLLRLLPDARNVIVVPLTAEGRATGSLVLEHALRTGSRVEHRVISAVERFAAYAALALRNAGLLEQVQRMAATDGLTAIANRRTFESTLEREIARAARHKEPVSLVMVDIDHFKALNDTHGHQVGDEVLRNVAAALACECREFDLAARYGGEEFALILPGCTSEESVVIAERFRRVVSAAPAVVPITASAGVATYPDHARGAEDLVRVADSALYESKRAGRDRVTAAKPRLSTAGDDNDDTDQGTDRSLADAG